MRAQQIPALIVTGFHRSGTSMMMQTLARAGLVIGDDLLPPGPSNPDGHFEDRSLVRLHDAELEHNGGSWYQPAASTGKSIVSSSMAADVAAALAPYNDQSELWGFKDPRTCLFLYQWQQMLAGAKYVIVYREPAACVRSLLARQVQSMVYQPILRGDELFFWQDPNSALALWIRYNEAILDFSQANRDDVILVPYESLLDGLCLPGLVNRRFDLHLHTQAESGIRLPSGDRSAPAEMPDGIHAKTLETAVQLRADLDAICDGKTIPERSHPKTWSTGRNAADNIHKQLIKLGISTTDTEDQTETRPLAEHIKKQNNEVVDQPVHSKTELLGSTPKTAEDAKRIHELLLTANEHEAAEAWVIKYATVYHTDGLLNLKAGRTSMKLGDLTGATRFLEQAHALDQGNRVPLMFLGLIAIRQHNYALATSRFEQAIKRDAENPGLYLYLAQAQHKQGDNVTALATCLAGLAMQPEHAALVIQAISCHLSLRQYSEAELLCRNAMRQHPDDAELAMQFYHVLTADNVQKHLALPWFYRAILLKMRGIADYEKALNKAANAITPDARNTHLRDQIQLELDRLIQHQPDNDSLVTL